MGGKNAKFMGVESTKRQSGGIIRRLIHNLWNETYKYDLIII